jgi:hypothetical protein
MVGCAALHPPYDPRMVGSAHPTAAPTLRAGDIFVTRIPLPDGRGSLRWGHVGGVKSSKLKVERGGTDARGMHMGESGAALA